MWHCEERGQGRPLVLLHGIGMSSFAWSPVMGQLASQRRVLAFDVDAGCVLVRWRRVPMWLDPHGVAGLILEGTV